MGNTRNREIREIQSIQVEDKTIEVLYQRMGDRWFAFSLIDDEIFVGSITLNEIHGNPSEDASTDSSKSRN